MSTEGGGGNKPKSRTDTEVHKQEASQDTLIWSQGSNIPEKRELKGIDTTDPQRPSTVPLKTASTRSPSLVEGVSKRSPQETLSEHVGDQGNQTEGPPRQVIAVSASKGPAAFFNLARKFLVTDEMCDLSALEGAIVSAVDAAHLLERSKLAKIIRIQTSYVAVGPKRRKNQSIKQTDNQSRGITHTIGMSGEPQSYTSSTTMAIQSGETQNQPRATTGKPEEKGPVGKELRRARMIITVKRTDDYKKWLNENPLQEILTGDDDVVEPASASRSHPSK